MAAVPSRTAPAPLPVQAPLDVVIAIRNEARGLPPLLADLARAPRALVRDVLVVDGGSGDGSPRLARLAGARLISAAPGRGLQLAFGVAVSGAPWLLLLHGDVRLPPDWSDLVGAAIGDGAGSAWAFRLAIAGRDPRLHLVAWAANGRSRWRQLPYGDQGLLLERSLYERAGGIAPLPLMEDLEFVQRLRRHGAIRLLAGGLSVSDRRWRTLGVWRTTWLNARLRRRWRRGQDPRQLAAEYYGRAPEPGNPAVTAPETSAALGSPDA
ncbi:MAG: TIGR04283 family arsenosugar biosynthesis glycosyltransferase [Synechococcaceae cyanobacterium ELA739]